MTQIVTFARNAHNKIHTPEAPGIACLLDCLKNKTTIIASQSAAEPIVSRASLDQRLLCETSGTSGDPKAICRKPETWIKSFEITKNQFHISAEDTYATFGSLGHSLSLYAALEGLWLGAGICCLSGQGPRTQARALKKFGVSVIYATPTQLKILLKGARASQISTFPIVRRVFCGGGKLTQDLRAALRKDFPAASIYEFFGASETSFIAISDSSTPPGSVGRPYPGVEIKIGTAPDANPQETGEMWVKSPYLFERYAVGDSTDTIWNGEFLSIGELGYINQDGYLFVQGRKNRMVTVADTNVFPEEIERTIGALDDVECCAVLSKTDGKRGNIPICIVQSAGNRPDAAFISNRCRAELGQHSVPKEIHFIAQMPLLASGKPDLETLNKTYGTP